MAKKREFGEGPIYTAANYIMWFFGLNFLFVICNALVILTIAAFGKNLFEEGFIPLMISLILTGPAITAMCSTMGKLVREKDINFIKDYFKFYRLNFKQSMVAWFIFIISITIIVIDIKSYAIIKYPRIMITIFYAMFFWIILLYTYILPILSRFYLKTRELFKIAVICCFSRIKTTILNFAILIICIFFLYQFISYSILIIGSIFFYLLMFNMNGLLKELQKKTNV